MKSNVHPFNVKCFQIRDNTELYDKMIQISNKIPPNVYPKKQYDDLKDIILSSNETKLYNISHCNNLVYSIKKIDLKSS